MYLLNLSKNCGLSLFGAYIFMILREKPGSCKSTRRRLPTLSVVIFFIEYSKLFLKKNLWRPYLSPLYKIQAHYLPGFKLSPRT